MPAVEACYALGFVLWGDTGLVKGRVTWMFQLSFSQPFVVVYSPIADKLDLRDSGNGLEVGVKDRFLGTPGLVVPVAVALGLGIECLRSVVRIFAYISGSCRITLVKAYCCSGVRTTSRNKRASCC